MKIPLDFILRIIEKFLNEHEMENVIKKLRKHFETPEEDFSDIISELSLQEIISKYVKENKELKKKIKSKVKKYMKEHKDEEEEDEKIEKEEKLITKKRKRTLSNAKEEEPEAKPEKKRKRTMSSTKEEKEEIIEPKKRKRTLSNAKEEKEKEEKKSKKKLKLEESDNEEKDKDKKDEEVEKPKKSKNKDKKKKDEDDIDLEKEVKFIPKPKSDNNPDRVPFKRIDDSKLKHEVPEKYRDNSYAAYLKQTGDDFGKAANDKLIVTRGKGFRKEKTKFKNKTFHGGMTISTTVRSIPLEDDDSSDD